MRKCLATIRDSKVRTVFVIWMFRSQQVLIQWYDLTSLSWILNYFCLAQEWDVVVSASLRIEVLSSIRQVASKLSSLPGRCGIEKETYYWTAIYNLNIRLYEKLLFGVFDTLDEGQVIEVDFLSPCFSSYHLCHAYMSLTSYIYIRMPHQCFSIWNLFGRHWA